MHWSVSIPPENLRKPEVIFILSGGMGKDCGLKWVKQKLFSYNYVRNIT